MRARYILLLIALTLGVPIAIAQPLNPDVAALVKGNNEFAFDLYRQLSKTKGNIVFSPYSISTALAMTYAGARGTTADEMARTLHFTLSQDRLNRAYAKLIPELLGDRDKPRPFQLHTANAIWGQRGFPFRSEYCDRLDGYYHSPFHKVDFAADTEKARQVINNWVEVNTNKKIKDMVKPENLSPRTKFVLANAIYFNAKWAYPFEKSLTRKGDFHLTAKQKVSVPMMHLDSSFKYMETDELRMVELPYKDSTISFLILLPKRIDGLADLEKTLTASNIQSLTAKLKGINVALSMPRFAQRTRRYLSNDLREMGMAQAFSANADFSEMASERLKIDEVIHEAVIEVDEKGTEAAAATVVIGGEPVSSRMPSRPQFFRADRPFLFAIQDHGTGSILFLGRVMEPRE